MNFELNALAEESNYKKVDVLGLLRDIRSIMLDELKLSR